MKRLFKNLGATVGVLLLVVLIVLLAKAISMIPIGAIIALFFANWKGVLAGVILSHLGIAITEFFGWHKEQKEDDNE